MDYRLAQKIQEAIIKIIDKKFSERGRDNYYITGIITAINGNLYTVKINNDTDTLKAKDNKVFAVNDIVLIMIPNGNRSNAFIDCKRPY